MAPAEDCPNAGVNPPPDTAPIDLGNYYFHRKYFCIAWSACTLVSSIILNFYTLIRFCRAQQYVYADISSFSILMFYLMVHATNQLFPYGHSDFFEVLGLPLAFC